MPSFKDELKDLINKYSLENESNTPDFILSEYLLDCLAAYERTVNQRDAWFGETYSYPNGVRYK